MTDKQTLHPLNGTLNGAQHDDIPVLRITMEQRGCLIEVNVPEKALPPIMEMKEYMRNTGADMYARLWHMIQMAEKGEEQ
jgi:hypothetical protein